MKIISRKKKVYIGIIVVLIIYLFIYIKSIKTITSPAFFSGREIEITLVTSYDWSSLDPSYVRFATWRSPEQIKRTILKWDPEAHVEIQEQSIFISSLNPDTGKRDYYYLYTSSSSLRRFYRIDDFVTSFWEDKDNIESYRVEFMVPMHLLCFEDYVQPVFFKQGWGQFYEMIPEANIEDVYNFYNDSGYYEVEWSGDEIVLKETFFDNIVTSDGFVRNFQMEKPMIIRVITEDEKTFFSCTVEGVGE